MASLSSAAGNPGSESCDDSSILGGSLAQGFSVAHTWDGALRCMQRRELLNGSASVWAVFKTTGRVKFEMGAGGLLS